MSAVKKLLSWNFLYVLNYILLILLKNIVLLNDFVKNAIVCDFT